MGRKNWFTCLAFFFKKKEQMMHCSQYFLVIRSGSSDQRIGVRVLDTLLHLTVLPMKFYVGILLYHFVGENFTN
jgi:hypothetical protein